MEFENILIVCPSTERKGGIASVLKKYKNNFDLVYFSSTHFQSSFLSFLFLPERLLSFILVLFFNKKIKVVHIHGSSQGSFMRKVIFYKLAKWFNKKVVYHIHSGRFINFYKNSNATTKKAIKYVINTTDVLVVLSKSWAGQYKNLFNPKAIDVIPNMISKPQTEVVRQLKKSNEKIHVVFLGKIFKPKGIYDLLDCIIENYDAFKATTTFTIAGNGEEDQTQKYREQDTDQIINFTGWIDQEEKDKILSESDILILPSYSEGLPVSILEAMSYKMAIIATPVGGVPDIVENNVNGILFEPGNKTAIFNTLTQYIENKKLIIEQGEKSYKKVINHFPENVRKDLIRIYNSI